MNCLCGISGLLAGKSSLVKYCLRPEGCGRVSCSRRRKCILEEHVLKGCSEVELWEEAGCV